MFVDLCAGIDRSIATRLLVRLSLINNISLITSLPHTLTSFTQVVPQIWPVASSPRLRHRLSSRRSADQVPSRRRTIVSLEKSWFGRCHHHVVARYVVVCVLFYTHIDVCVCCCVGIHAPCRTVVICDDNTYLNPTVYHQMTGRAGRRGFDDVI